MKDIDIVEMIDIYTTMHCIKLIKFISNNEKYDFNELFQHVYSLKNNELIINKV